MAFLIALSDRRAMRNLFCVLRQIRNMDSHGRQIYEDVHEPYVLLGERQHENILRRCHDADQWGEMKAIRCLGERLGAVRQSKSAHHLRRRQYGEAVSLEFPELI